MSKTNMIAIALFAYLSVGAATQAPQLAPPQSRQSESAHWYIATPACPIISKEQTDAADALMHDEMTLRELERLIGPGYMIPPPTGDPVEDRLEVGVLELEWHFYDGSVLKADPIGRDWKLDDNPLDVRLYFDRNIWWVTGSARHPRSKSVVTVHLPEVAQPPPQQSAVAVKSTPTPPSGTRARLLLSILCATIIVLLACILIRSTGRKRKG